MSSPVLSRDIEDVREKVERMKSGREVKENEGVKRAREGVVKCYKCVIVSSPLHSLSLWETFVSWGFV